MVNQDINNWEDFDNSFQEPQSAEEITQATMSIECAMEGLETIEQLNFYKNIIMELFDNHESKINRVSNQ